MTQLTEIAPDLFRISTFVPEADLQFNQFVVRDDEPLLFHTGLRKLFPLVRDAVAPMTDGILASLAELQPKTLAVMHGSTFVGEGARALRECAAVFREVMGGEHHGAA